MSEGFAEETALELDWLEEGVLEEGVLEEGLLEAGVLEEGVLDVDWLLEESAGLLEDGLLLEEDPELPQFF